MDQLSGFTEALLGYVPVVAFGAPLVAFIVDAAKRFGLPDGKAPLVAGLINLALFSVVFFVGKEHEKGVQDAVQALVLVAPAVLALFVQLLATAKAHAELTKIGVGFQHQAAEKALAAG